MKFVKRNTALNSIKEVVLANTNSASLNELNAVNKEFFISGFDEAYNLIKSCILENRHIYVYGDYDCDGVCSSIITESLLSEVFGLNNNNYTIKLPCRFNDGYGLSLNYCKDTIENNSLVITVDNGITAVDQIKLLKDVKNCKCIIFDHHLARADKVLPDADVIIDPEALGNATFDGYCAAGLLYKFNQYCVHKREQESVKVDALQPLYCKMYAAIATVADIVPLLEDNRIIVKDGIKLINERGTLFLKTLFNQQGLERVDEATIGFLIAPLINAMGRLKENGAQILEQKIFQIDRSLINPVPTVQSLIENNEIRKLLCSKGEEYCNKEVKQNQMFRPINPIVVWEKNKEDNEKILHSGIVGIVAGRLAETYKTPAFVLTETQNGMFVGSARTFGNINIKEMLDAANEKGLLEAYGGHAAAAGLTVKEENLIKLRDFFIGFYIEKDYKVDTNMYYDVEISINNRRDAEKVLRELSKYAPYGEKNPKPIFLFKANLVPLNSKYYGLLGKSGEHIKLRANDIEIVGFGLAQKYLKNEPKSINAIGSLSENIFMGESRPQFLMTDFEELHSSLSPLAQALQNLLN